MTLTVGGQAFRPAQRRRAFARLRRTEGHLVLLAAVLVLTGVATGAACALSVQNRMGLLDDVAERRGPALAAALDIHQALSDADVALAGAMLVDDAKSHELYGRYRRAIALTAVRLSVAAVATSADSLNGIDAGAREVADLSNHLPVYTGLVETARTYTRMGMPLGSAYLRQASFLVRDTMLPSAQRLYRYQIDRQNAEQQRASAWPRNALTLLVSLLVALVLTQVYLCVRTKRMVNVGLIAATLSASGALIWLAVSLGDVTAHVRASYSDGTAQISALTEARIKGLQAHAGEAMTLFARDSGTQLERLFQDDTNGLLGYDGVLAGAKETVRQPETQSLINDAFGVVMAWRTAHGDMRRLDNGANYWEAVRATTEGPLSGRAKEYDDLLGRAIHQADERFRVHSTQARAALAHTDLGIAVLIGLATVFAAAGMWPRIAEYR